MMKKFFYNKDFLPLLLGAISFVIYGFVEMNTDLVIDINIYDTYYVISAQHLNFFFACVLILFLILYWILNKIKIPILSILNKCHVYGMLISLAGLYFPYSFFINDKPYLFDDSIDINSLIMYFLMFFILVQLFFIVNILLGIFKKIRSS